MMNIPPKFAFQDEGEALRRLGVDRDTLLALVRAGRLRAYRGFGTGSFFRTQDLEDLRAELYGERDRAQAAEGEAEQTSTRKVFDPAYKVHVRLQADLKWYDLEDEDLRAWAREMTPDGYARQRMNIQRVIEKLQRMLALMDEQAATWKHLAPPTTATTASPADAPQRKARAPLPMAGTAPAPPATPATPATPAPTSPPATADARDIAPEKKVRKPLPMAGMPGTTGIPTPTPPARREPRTEGSPNTPNSPNDASRDDSHAEA